MYDIAWDSMIMESRHRSFKMFDDEFQMKVAVRLD
jgi:hypothetical protein